MSNALRKLVKLFVYIGETEMQIEFARQNLCKAANFEPYAAFQRVDRDDKGYILARDVYRYMK